jgi:16S rRNA (cytidine1402-2'-O)-methyltransferase
MLVVAATPLGNLGDLSPRLAEALRGADLVAAEDTRRTRILLTSLGLSRPLISFRSHNQARQTAAVLEQLRRGKRVVLVTDAGTPGISDPGFLVVREASREGFAVDGIPGPSAAALALSISGFPAERFVFEGFLPHKKGRRTRLAQMAAEPRTVVFFESPHRVRAALAALAELCPERPLLVARELTKIHQELTRGTAAEVAGLLGSREPRGEYTLVLGSLP